MVMTQNRSRRGERREHFRVDNPNLYMSVDGQVYQPVDASLGGFAIAPYGGDLWIGDRIEGEMITPDKQHYPFVAEVVKFEEIKGKLSCRFTTLSDDGFDVLTETISSKYTYRNAIEEMERDGRASDFFIRRIKRIPEAMLSSFDREQLEALRRIFDGTEKSRHAIDWRFTMPVFGRSLYFVLFVGRDKRLEERKQIEKLKKESKRFRPFAALATVIVNVVFAAVLMALIALPLYALKILVGIDIFEATGVHGVFSAIVEQLGAVF